MKQLLNKPAKKYLPIAVSIQHNLVFFNYAAAGNVTVSVQPLPGLDIKLALPL
jgi:hypothetical protein